MEQLEERKRKLLEKLRMSKNWLIYVALAFIIWFGYYIRTRSLGLLKDITTGKYIPLALDPFAFLRYVTYLLQKGHLMAVDTLRYYPFGYNQLAEFRVLTYFIVYLYKFLHFFNSSITIELAHLLYPPIAFSIAMLFFFLLIRKLFDYKIALLATAFLVVAPSFLFRTIAGFSDKEALATLFMFVSLYLYVCSWKSKKIKHSIILGALAGLFTGLMGLVWGGVNFVFLIIGSFALILIILNKFNKKLFLTYSCWLFVLVIILMVGYPQRFTLGNLFTSLTSLIIFIVFFVALVDYLLFDLGLFKLRDKIKEKAPKSLISLLIVIIFGVIFVLIFFGHSFIIFKVNDLLTGLLEPFGTTRWALTVAESHQPYFTDWIEQFGWKFILLFMLGSIYLFYETIKPLKKRVKTLTLSYAAFIFLFAMSRYNTDSQFNGVTPISKFVYLGSLIAFFLILVLVYLYSFYKDKELFNNLSKLKKNIIFVLLWFFFMVVAARGAIRLLYIFTPITTVLAGYFAVRLFKKAKYFREDIYKIASYIAIVVIVAITFFGFAKTTLDQAKYFGPSYNQQWQVAMQWVRENTPKDAVFAHWWDYGYWVQYGGERATLSDGGNARGAINYFIGRHVLTAQNETEALELLKANNATHLLIISDEIGKYPAFSSIGSDENYDRYSWINTFALDPSIQETRDKKIYIYRGGTILDEDFIYQGKLFPTGVAGIGAFFVPIANKEVGEGNETKTEQGFEQPLAVLVYNGQQFSVPVKCLFFEDTLMEFEGEGLDGCLRFISKIDGDQMNKIGAVLYIPPRVRRTLFADLYLFNKKSDYFKLVYNDEQGMPLALYQGRIIGPLKIWEISYPDKLNIPELYYGTELPSPDVLKVKK